MRIGALETGGTKVVMGIFSEQGEILQEKTISTGEPRDTVPQICLFFKENDIQSLGIATFGPMDRNRNSPTYGSITTTPKLAWQFYPLLNELQKGLDIPIAIDTDVNASVLAEVRQGAAKGLSSAVYVTVGTGIGGGIYVEDRLINGMMHPEIGHMLLKPGVDDPCPKGICPYHDGCLEGLASGPSLTARVAEAVPDLPDDHMLFDLEAYYLAQMCANLILTVCPERIVLGGGVMRRECLYDKVRKETLRLLGGYMQHPSILDSMDEYITKPALFPISGLFGAYLLGMEARKG